MGVIADDDLQSQTDKLKEDLNKIAYQIMMMQHGEEEYRRNNAGSGIQQGRAVEAGTRPYFDESHTGKRFAVIHDHGDSIRTVGIGEISAVLNGVHFRSRHNDYQMMMPSKTSGDFLATEEVPYPPVPPQVLAAGTDIPKAIAEMKKCFKAWIESDDSECDYNKYFKPVLCYMEGFWHTREKYFEPFDSERHHIDAKTWKDLHEKAKFDAGTGRKDKGENFAWLPTKIFNVTEEGGIQTAQWTYRVQCKEIEIPLPLTRFRTVDDIKVRVTKNKYHNRLWWDRATRFQLHPFEKKWTEGEREQFVMDNSGSLPIPILDRIMATVPGLDNAKAGLLRDSAYSVDTYRQDAKDKSGSKLKPGFYHRYFREFEPGAMGTFNRRRGFSDHGGYMAMTSHEDVAPVHMKHCMKTPQNKRECTHYTQRWSYAIPLEIIYLNPLQSWNPYKLKHWGWANKDENGHVPTANARNGGLSKNIAYNGTNSKNYYRTPAEFFSSTGEGDEDANADKADTVKNAVGVLDENGDMHKVAASGIRIFLPKMPEFGELRQRFPIAPVHGEGSSVYKEVNALKDFCTKWESYDKVFVHEAPVKKEEMQKVKAEMDGKITKLDNKLTASQQRNAEYFEKQRQMAEARRAREKKEKEERLEREKKRKEEELARKEKNKKWEEERKVREAKQKADREAREKAAAEKKAQYAKEKAERQARWEEERKAKEDAKKAKQV